MPNISKWRIYSRQVIAKVLSENKGADTKTLRKILHDAYPFGERNYYPYKIWLEECRRALTTPHPAPQIASETGELELT